MADLTTPTSKARMGGVAMVNTDLGLPTGTLADGVVYQSTPEYCPTPCKFQHFLRLTSGSATLEICKAPTAALALALTGTTDSTGLISDTTGHYASVDTDASNPWVVVQITEGGNVGGSVASHSWSEAKVQLTTGEQAVSLETVLNATVSNADGVWNTAPNAPSTNVQAN